MRRDVVGRCQQRSRRLTVASSRNAQHGSSFPLQSVTNTLKIPQCKFTHNSTLTDNSQYCSYREQVERNQIKLSLSGTWPAILYNKDATKANDELAGLFRSKTLLRVCPLSISFLQSLTTSGLSAGLQSCAVHLQDENGNTLMQVPGRSLQARRNQMPRSTESIR